MNGANRPLISAPALRTLLDGPAAPPLLLDCRFDLLDPDAGERAYAQAHLPGARYAHLERDLSGAKHGVDGAFRGRHPLPERLAFAETAARWGITPASTVVAYDDQGGPYAARAWWLLRWLGHDNVTVLDGGIAAWLAAGGALDDDAPPALTVPAYPVGAATLPTIDAATLQRGLGRLRVLDARAAERFRGEVEPLDRAAGHIPGAVNRYFKDNLQSDGRFKTPARLQAEWQPLLAPFAIDAVVQQCGSGVTACHNLLALEYAGLGTSTLYPGSWSEWSADPLRPVALG